VLKCVIGKTAGDGGKKMIDKELEAIKKIDKQIEDGLDVAGLKRARNRLYKFKDGEISIEAWTLKHIILGCIKEMLTEE
jgi:hypothetical protein